MWQAGKCMVSQACETCMSGAKDILDVSHSQHGHCSQAGRLGVTETCRDKLATLHALLAVLKRRS